MKDFKTKLLQEIEKAGKHIYRYWRLSLKYDIDFQINSVEDFLKDSTKAVKWFCGTTFFAGRGDWLSDIYRRAFFITFSRIFSDDIDDIKIKEKIDLLLENFKEEVSKIKKLSGEAYKVRGRDLEAIRNSLEFVANNLKEYNFNPVKFLKEKIEKHEVREFIEKVRIKQVGLKLKSMMIRDVVVWYNLKLTDEELRFIFPVDVWVRELCSRIWPETKNMKEKELMNYITLRLKEMKISPTYFNAGLWAIGWHGRNAVKLLLESQIYLSRTSNEM